MNPGFHVPASELVLIMAVATLLGIILGWLYWKQGLECAILAHFLVDAMAAGIVVPAFLSGNRLLIVAVLGGMVLLAAICWRVLMQTGTDLTDTKRLES